MKKAKPKAPPPKAVVPIELLYLGERVGTLGVIRQTFRNPSGELQHYNGVKRVWFGDSYVGKSDGSIKSHPEAWPNAKLVATEKERLEFETHKELAKHERALRRKDMELKKPHKDIVQAVRLLRPFARSLDQINFNRFIGYLKNQISKKGKL